MSAADNAWSVAFTRFGLGARSGAPPLAGDLREAR